MKKGLLRALSAVVAISMLFCMSMVAFADGVSQNVVTTYNPSAGTVTVTSEVTGAQSGEQVAFLVEKGENIIWIDQQLASGSAVTSSFTASVNEAKDAVVRVGTTSTAASQINEGTVTLPNYTVNWEVEGSNKATVIAVVNDNVIAQGGTTSDEVVFYFAAPANEELVAVNGAVPVIIGDAVAYTITENTTFTFTFAEKTIAEDAVATATTGEVTTYTAASKQASVAATAANATEFGIVVAQRGYDFSGVADNFASLEVDGGEGVEVIKLAALGANAEGQFVIVIDDAAGSFFVEGAEYDAKVYAVKNGVPVLSADTFALN